MKVRILLFLLATCVGVLGQTKTLNQFPELPEAPNAADWVYQWDVSEAKSVKVRVDNFFKALPIAGLTTIGGVKRNVGGAGEFVSGVDASGNLVYGVPAGGGGISITGYRVPYGNGSGSLTSEGGFEYDALANKLSVVNASVSEVRFGTNNISIGSPTPGSLYISEGTLTGDELVFDLTSDNAARLYSGTLVSTFQFDGIDVIVPTEVYDSGTWNGSNEVPTKDAVRDKIEAVILGGPALTTTLVGYGSGTGALTGEAGFEYNPSTNTFKVDKILSRSELQIAGAGGTPDNVGIYSPAAGSIGFFEGTLTGDDLIFDLSVDNAARVYSLAGVGSLEFDGISLVGYGTTKSGTQATPTITNPFSPTWSSQDYILWYGATGQVNLPGVSGYTNKTILIYSTGAYTVTVDPSGSEIIVVEGVSLGAGTSDVVNTSTGLIFGYTCDGSRWIKTNGVSVDWDLITGTPNFMLYDANLETWATGVASFSVDFQSDTTFTGPQILGYETVTGLAMDRGKAGGIYSPSGNATLTFSGAWEIAGQSYILKIIGDGTARTTTLPSCLNPDTGVTAAHTITTPIDGVSLIRLEYEGARVVAYGLDPIATGTDAYVRATAPTITNPIIGTAGVQLAGDGDGAITFTGQGNGSDEAFTLNLDDTANTISLTSSTGVTTFDFGTVAVTGPVNAYDATGWNGSGKFTTEDAVRDKIESISAGGASITGNRQNVVLWEEFIGISNSNSFGVLGLLRETTGGGILAVTATNTDTSPGQVNLYTGTGTTNKIGIMSNATPSGWILGGGTYVLEQRVFIESLAATTTNEYVFRSGFLDALASQPVDGVYFQYDAASANWVTVCRANNVETASAVASSTAVVEDVWIKLRIEINAAATQALFYVDGTLIRTETANIPTGAARYTSIGTSAIKAAGAVDNDFFIDYYGLEIGLSASR